MFVINQTLKRLLSSLSLPKCQVTRFSPMKKGPPLATGPSCENCGHHMLKDQGQEGITVEGQSSERLRKTMRDRAYPFMEVKKLRIKTDRTDAMVATGLHITHTRAAKVDGFGHFLK